jgi:hypothetical protein
MMELITSEKWHAALSIPKKIENVVASNVASWLVLITFFFIVAAAAHSGFIAKWSLRDSPNPIADSRYSFESMIDGAAHKPFVYRQFMPALANLADSVFSTQFKDYVVKRFNPSESYARAVSANHSPYAFRYRVIYTLNFLSLFLSLFLLRSIVLSAGGRQMEASFAPTAFILAFPYLQTVGGYFYDSAELAFLSAAVLAAVKRKYLLLLALSAFGTYNKESFFFFLPTLYPLLRVYLSPKRTVAIILPTLLISGLVNLLLKTVFASNNGGAAEFHLLENFRNYLLPWFYRQLEVTYGMPGPHGAFFLTLVVGLLITIRGWPCLPHQFKRHTILCFLVNFPLLMLFCATGELRNLSFMYVDFVIFLAFSMKLYSLDKEERQSKLI